MKNGLLRMRKGMPYSPQRVGKRAPSAVKALFLLAAALLLSGCMVTDYAHQTKTKAEKKADLRECYERTGSSSISPTDAFKKCMVDKGYTPYEYML